MKNFRVQSRVAPFVIAILVLLPFSPARTGVASLSASSDRDRDLHVTKECSKYTGAAGSFCTITSSNIPEIKVGSRVYYSQAIVKIVDPGSAESVDIFLDSNVVLYAGSGDWAVGRCTLDPTFNGLCTFSNGVGPFAGFHARVAVSPIGAPNFLWDGTYGFTPEFDRD